MTAPHKQREALIDTFYTSPARTGDVYAILDLARDPRIFDFLPRSPNVSVCLYEGVLPYSVARVAPYLVTFKGPWDPLLDELLKLGWGQSWGIFVGSPMNRFDLRTHLRRFLKVQTDGGQVLLFRYYDPRVLPPFLGAINAEERRKFFGPIDCFWYEEDGGKRVVEATQGGTALGTRSVTLPVASQGAQA